MNATIDPGALFSIGYGLYVITAKEGEKDNGMIGNAVMQVTQSPMRVAVAINKASYTHDMIVRTGKMNVNCLSEKTPFAVFQHFGFQSGKDTDKFKEGVALRSENGVAVLPEYANAVLSLTVESYTDLGTHGLFLCAVTEAKTLSSVPTMTYTYYQNNVKPKPQKKKGYVCKICGYVYEGDPLPEDFICPLCKHGAEDFEPLT